MTVTMPNRTAISDEQQIRDLITTWLRASAAGDLDTVLSLMSEDAVFLIPGQPPMIGREKFAAMARSMAGKIRFEGHSEVQEIQVSGDFAYCWTKLRISVQPLPGGETQRRSGHTLSVLRKEPAGNWVLIRDANLLAPEK
jgi:uncharacterized protein (TIGR02246 family)